MFPAQLVRPAALAWLIGPLWPALGGTRAVRVSARASRTAADPGSAGVRVTTAGGLRSTGPDQKRGQRQPEQRGDQVTRIGEVIPQREGQAESQQQRGDADPSNPPGAQPSD